MHSWWYSHIKPLPMPSDHILKYMLQSGAYIPSPVWTMSSTGRGADFPKLQAMWHLIISGVENCSITTARFIFFDMRSTDIDIAGDGLWEGSLANVLEVSRGLREAAAAVREANQDANAEAVMFARANAVGGAGPSNSRPPRVFDDSQESQDELAAMLADIDELDGMSDG
jgi:hypothetical protein